MTDVCTINNKLCELRCGMSPALTQNPSLSLLSSDTGTKPTHLVYKTCQLGLLPDRFPTSLASSSVFLPARHVKTVLFSGIFNAIRRDSLGDWLSPSSSMGCGGITGLIPCGLALAQQLQTPPGSAGHVVHLQMESCLLSRSNVCSILLHCCASAADLCTPPVPLPKQPVSLRQLGEVLNSHSVNNLDRAR